MTFLDWVVVVIICGLSLIIGSICARRASQEGGEGFFTANRSLSWFTIGISNSATYQSGLGAFVTLIFVFGLVGNWLWWAQWIIWMPLVAIIWARMWRRMGIVTTAELISLRYGGKPAYYARKIYALAMFSLSILVIAYITGFFAKTVAPLIPMSPAWILIIFGSVTVAYTMFGGLMGSVMVAVLQMGIMIVGSLVFLWIIVPQNGGWSVILEKVNNVRSVDLSLSPISDTTPPLTLFMFVFLGLFFAGSPTAGDGMTAQRFMAAKNERHAIGGQLFNAFIALSLRIVPLVGLGIVAMSLFWNDGLVETHGPAPEGFKSISEPAYAWGELVKISKLPAGFTGLMVATEIAAFMSTLSALVNWGSSFIINDFYKEYRPNSSFKQEVQASRIVTVLLFVVASIISILFVDNMVSWFLFINSVVVIFWLPLAYFRFFWSRFNVWGEIAATVLSLPISILFWFVLDFKDEPYWKGMGGLFLTAVVTIVLVTLMTRPESNETLKGFYTKCRPLAGWKKIRSQVTDTEAIGPSLGHLIFDSILAMFACLGLVITTNAVFVCNWFISCAGLFCVIICSLWLLKRLSGESSIEEQSLNEEKLDLNELDELSTGVYTA